MSVFAIWVVVIEKPSLPAMHQMTTLTVNIMFDILLDEVVLGELSVASLKHQKKIERSHAKLVCRWSGPKSKSKVPCLLRHWC